MSYRPIQGQQPGPSNFQQQQQNMLNPQNMAGPGRTSPMPSVPQVSQPNIGQPGSMRPGEGPIPAAAQANAGGQVQGSGAEGLGSLASDKGRDYVYFERKPGQFSEAVQGKAMGAKMKLELFYKEAVEGVVGRKER